MGIKWHAAVTFLNNIDVFLIAFFTVVGITPWVSKLAHRFGWLDQPGDRKIHALAIPRVGGLAIYAGFVLAFVVEVFVFHHIERAAWVWPILGGATLLVLLGLWDDVRGSSAWVKLLFQIAIAALTYYWGIRIEFVNNPFGTGFWYLQNLSFPFTVMWMVVFINVINLIDGLDGLAAGLTSIAATTLLVGAVITHQNDAAILALILLAICLGFLRHNFFPASIFMGDCGSMLLGYLLAITSMIGLLKSTASIALAVPLLALAIPLLDTSMAIIRRMRKRQPIFKPDKEHLHHLLLFRGYSQRQVALILYYSAAALSFFGILFSFLKGFWAWACLSLVAFVVYWGIQMVRKLSLQQP